MCDDTVMAYFHYCCALRCVALRGKRYRDADSVSISGHATQRSTTRSRNGNTALLRLRYFIKEACIYATPSRFSSRCCPWRLFVDGRRSAIATMGSSLNRRQTCHYSPSHCRRRRRARRNWIRHRPNGCSLTRLVVVAALSFLPPFLIA